MLGGRRAQRLGEDLEGLQAQRELALVTAHRGAAHTEQVAQVELEQALEGLLAEHVEARVQLDLPAAIDEVEEGGLALAAARGEAPGDTVDGVGFLAGDEVLEAARGPPRWARCRGRSRERRSPPAGAGGGLWRGARPSARRGRAPRCCAMRSGGRSRPSGAVGGLGRRHQGCASSFDITKKDVRGPKAEPGGRTGGKAGDPGRQLPPRVSYFSPTSILVILSLRAGPRGTLTATVSLRR